MPVLEEKRALVLNVILTVITGGLFGIWWLYEIMTDLESKGGPGSMPKEAHAGLCLIPIVGWYLAAKTMAAQWDAIRVRSEREPQDWDTIFVVLGILCPAGLLALNVAISDNYGDGPEPIDPVQAALDSKNPNAQNAQLVQMLQKQQEQMEEMQLRMQQANFKQNQMLKQQNAQMQAQMNAMKQQVDAANKQKAADAAAAQERSEKLKAELQARKAKKEAALNDVVEVDMSAGQPAVDASMFGGSDVAEVDSAAFGGLDAMFDDDFMSQFGGAPAEAPTQTTNNDGQG